MIVVTGELDLNAVEQPPRQVLAPRSCLGEAKMMGEHLLFIAGVGVRDQPVLDGSSPVDRLRIDHLGGVTLPEEFDDGADPAAPAAGARIYVVKTAGGKRQLAARFPTGAPQIVATEP